MAWADFGTRNRNRTCNYPLGGGYYIHLTMQANLTLSLYHLSQKKSRGYNVFAAFFIFSLLSLSFEKTIDFFFLLWYHMFINYVHERCIMKKIVSICLAVIMLISALVVSAFAIYGDIFKDNTVNSLDAVKLAQYLAKWDIEFTAEDEKNADVHYDGVINAADAVKLAQYIAKWDVVLGPSGNVGGDDTTGGDNVSGGDIEVGAGDIFG